MPLGEEHPTSGGDTMLNHENSNLLSSLIDGINSGKMSVDDVSKLLNTVARFEERTSDKRATDSLDNGPHLQ